MRTSILIVALWPTLAVAQLHVSKPKPRPPAPARSVAASYQPVDCKRLTEHHPAQPWLRQVCESTDYNASMVLARGLGRPHPSPSVIGLPAHGSATARQYGLACLGQLGMKRLDNGWEQLRDREGRYQRCRDL